MRPRTDRDGGRFSHPAALTQMGVTSPRLCGEDGVSRGGLHPAPEGGAPPHAAPLWDLSAYVMSPLWGQPVLKVPGFAVTLLCPPHGIPAEPAPLTAGWSHPDAPAESPFPDSAPRGSDSAGPQWGSAFRTTTLTGSAAGDLGEPPLIKKCLRPSRGRKSHLEIVQGNRTKGTQNELRRLCCVQGSSAAGAGPDTLILGRCHPGSCSCHPLLTSDFLT